MRRFDQLTEVQQLRLQGRHQDAYAAATRLLHSPQPTTPSDDAVLRNELGLLLKAVGEYRRAREQYELGLRGLLTQPGAGDSDEAATLLHNLAGIRFVLGDPKSAARCSRRGLAMRRRLWGPDDLAVLLDEGNLAPIHIALGEYARAQRMLNRLLAEFTRRLGPTDIEVAVTLSNLGTLAAHTHDWATARKHLAHAAAIKRTRCGPGNPELVGTLANLAVALHHVGDEAGSRAAGAEARHIALASLSPGHPLRQHIEALSNG